MLKWLLKPVVLQLSSSLVLSTILVINSWSSYVILPTITASSLGVFSASLIVIAPLICCAFFMIFANPQHPIIWPAIPSLLCFIGALVLHQLTAVINLSFIITSGIIISLQIASMIHHYHSIANDTPPPPKNNKNINSPHTFAMPVNAKQVIAKYPRSVTNKLGDMTYFIHLFHPKNAELARSGWYRPNDNGAYTFYLSHEELKSYLNQHTENGSQPEFHESTYLSDLVYVEIGQSTLPESIVNTHHLKWNRKYQCWSNQDIRMKLFDSMTYSIVEQGLLSPTKEADHVTYTLTHNLDRVSYINTTMERKPILTESFNTLRTFAPTQNITIRDDLGNFISHDAFFKQVLLFNLASMPLLKGEMVNHLNSQFNDLLTPCKSELKYDTSKGWHIPRNDTLFDDLLNRLDDGEAHYFDPNRQYVFLQYHPSNDEPFSLSTRYQNTPLIAIDANHVRRYQDEHFKDQTCAFT